jgi:heterodisulfide reductase subunit C
MVLLGMRKEVLSSDTIWFCIQCYNCQGHCPQNVDFADIMKALRSMAVREGYIAPSFVNKVKDIDVFCQKLRHEMVSTIVESRSQGTEIEPPQLAKEALQRL